MEQLEMNSEHFCFKCPQKYLLHKLFFFFKFHQKLPKTISFDFSSSEGLHSNHLFQKHFPGFHVDVGIMGDQIVV